MKMEATLVGMLMKKFLIFAAAAMAAAAAFATGAGTDSAANAAYGDGWETGDDGADSGDAFGGVVRICAVAQAGAPVFTYYRDADGDGFGDMSNPVTGSTSPAGYVSDNTDWNDANASVYPRAPELCDEVDNNGNGQIDEVCRGQTCFSLNQSIHCSSSGWSHTIIMDLTNFRHLAVQDGYENYTIDFPLYYNIWTGIYLCDYGTGTVGALTWLTNLDL